MLIEPDLTSLQLELWNFETSSVGVYVGLRPMTLFLNFNL